MGFFGCCFRIQAFFLLFICFAFGPARGPPRDSRPRVLQNLPGELRSWGLALNPCRVGKVRGGFSAAQNLSPSPHFFFGGGEWGRSWGADPAAGSAGEDLFWPRPPRASPARRLLPDACECGSVKSHTYITGLVFQNPASSSGRSSPGCIFPAGFDFGAARRPQTSPCPPQHPANNLSGDVFLEGTNLRAKNTCFLREENTPVGSPSAWHRGVKLTQEREQAGLVCTPASAGTRTAPCLSPGLCSTGTGPWGTRPCPRRGRDFGAGFVTVGQLRCRVATVFFFIGCFVGEWWQGRLSCSPHRVPSVTCPNRPRRSPNERSGEGWGCAGQMSPPA